MSDVDGNDDASILKPREETPNNETATNKDSKDAAVVVIVDAKEISVTDSSASVDDGAQQLSKKQLKRRKKWEQAMAVKCRRKEQQKNIKMDKAKASGRDVEAERQLMEQQRREGIGWARRNEQWKERFQNSNNKFQLCLDCSFENQLTDKEINSLSSQIRFCYATNKKATHPVRVTVTSLGFDKTLDHLKKVDGFEQWTNREFHHTEKDLVDTYPDKTKLVYLTSDSETVLESVENDKIYIIGGIVDRNRLKRAAINRAEAWGIATAKLPISDHLHMLSTKVLTCNHVFDILLKWNECEKDWKKALLAVLPHRKEATLKTSKESPSKSGYL